jgi:hypothetical protein
MIQILLLTLFVKFSLQKVSKDNVVSIVELARHGSRGPFNNIGGAQWAIDSGPEELTMVGQRQRYILGMNMRKRYPTIFHSIDEEDMKNFTPAYIARNFYVRSSDINRTLNSGLSELMGIIHPFGVNDSVLPFSQQMSFSESNATQYFPSFQQGDQYNSNLSTSSPLPYNTSGTPIYTLMGAETDLYLEETCPPLRDKLAQQISTMLGKLNSTVYTNWANNY